MNKNWNKMAQPTPEQVAMTEKVQRALCNEVNLLAKEGIPVACLLTGLGLTIADLITCQAELQAVAPWFEKHAKMLRELQSEAKRLN